MTPGEEFQMLVGIEEIREIAPELVPGFEGMLDLMKFLKPPAWLLEEEKDREH